MIQGKFTRKYHNDIGELFHLWYPKWHQGYSTGPKVIRVIQISAQEFGNACHETVFIFDYSDVLVNVISNVLAA